MVAPAQGYCGWRWSRTARGHSLCPPHAHAHTRTLLAHLPSCGFSGLSSSGSGTSSHSALLLVGLFKMSTWPLVSISPPSTGHALNFRQELARCHYMSQWPCPWENKRNTGQDLVTCQLQETPTKSREKANLGPSPGDQESGPCDARSGRSSVVSPLGREQSSRVTWFPIDGVPVTYPPTPHFSCRIDQLLVAD